MADQSLNDPAEKINLFAPTEFLCTVCGGAKTRVEMKKARSGRGLIPLREPLICIKCCQSAYLKNYRATHESNRSEASKKVNKARSRERYQNDPDHREDRKTYAKKYRKENPEKVKASLKAWTEANPEYRRAYAREYYKTWKTGDDLKEYNRQLRARHAVKKSIRGAISRSKREILPGSFSNDHLVWLYRWQDNRCYYCNRELAEDNYQRPIEHIVPVQPSGTNHPYNIVRACARCNYSKQDRLFSTEWIPEQPLPADRFHSQHSLKSLLSVLKEKNIPFEPHADHVTISERPVFMLSTFWMSSRTMPIETVDTLRAKHPGSIFFFDHEWRERQEAILNVVSAKTHLSESVGARELEIGEPSFDEAKSFMDQWHTQGFSGGTWLLGLKSKTDWKAIAVFRDTKRGYELNRLAFRGHVSGGISRLIAEFKRRMPEQKTIFSFCDLRFGEGTGYLAAGFKSAGDSQPTMAFTNGVGLYHWYIGKRQNLPTLLDHYDEKLSELENLRINGIFRLTLPPRKKFILLP